MSIHGMISQCSRVCNPRCWIPNYRTHRTYKHPCGKIGQTKTGILCQIRRKDQLMFSIICNGLNSVRIPSSSLLHSHLGLQSCHKTPTVPNISPSINKVALDLSGRIDLVSNTTVLDYSTLQSRKLGDLSINGFCFKVLQSFHLINGQLLDNFSCLSS